VFLDCRQRLSFVRGHCGYSGNPGPPGPGRKAKPSTAAGLVPRSGPLRTVLPTVPTSPVGSNLPPLDPQRVAPDRHRPVALPRPAPRPHGRAECGPHCRPNPGGGALSALLPRRWCKAKWDESPLRAGVLVCAGPIPTGESRRCLW